MRRALLAMAAAAVAVATVLGAYGVGLLDRPEGDTVDVRFALRGAHTPADVAVVGIDDVTFGTLRTRWPFRRTLHARAIDALRRAGARVIAYDVQFTEPSERPSDDLALFDAVGRAPGTILATSEVGPGGSTAVLGGDANLAEVRARAAASYLPKDGRGVIRRFTRSVDGLDTLAVAAAEAMLGHRLPDDAIPPDGALIDYRGGPGTIRQLSFSDVIDPRWRPPAFLRGAVVVVGASSPSLQDVHLTPAGSDNPMSGPEVQANAIWTAIHGEPLRQAPRWLDLLAIVAMGAIAPALTLRVRFSRVAVAAGLLGAAGAAGAVIAFRAGIVVGLVAPLLALALGTLGVGLVGYLTETRERRRVDRLNAILDQRVRERTAQLRATHLWVVQRFSQAADSRDNETGEHIRRMSHISAALGRAAGMGEAEAEELLHASVLHDIGKIGVPDSVLLAPGRLTDEQRAVMQRHTTVGAEILDGSDSPLVRMARDIALTHHERWDGTGYPAGLAGEGIPLAGRVCAIADVFDALVSPRRYKPAWTLERTLEEFRIQRGLQFDPRLVDAFLPIAPGLYAELGYAADGVPAEEPVPAV